MAYIPERGDIVWITLDLQAGREQKGPKPALVISPVAYTKKVGLAICSPITSQVKGYLPQVRKNICCRCVSINVSIK